ncbi:MAG: hypothetical protein JXR76_16025 [Deltaproteobacteria bacterium]|nr:hypothetical protein [Deltaproteobacteria bacterium]
MAIHRRDILKLGAAASTAGLLKMIPGTAAAQHHPGSDTVGLKPSCVGAPGYVVQVQKPGMLQRRFPDEKAADES